MSVGPCYKCCDRHIGCMNTCQKPDFLAEQERIKKIREESKRISENNSAYFDARSTKRRKKDRRNSVHDRLRRPI